MSWIVHTSVYSVQIKRPQHVSSSRLPKQRAKKVVSDSLGLVDFAIGLVNSVFNWPDGEVMFFEEFK